MSFSNRVFYAVVTLLVLLVAWNTATKYVTHGSPLDPFRQVTQTNEQRLHDVGITFDDGR